MEKKNSILLIVVLSFLCCASFMWAQDFVLKYDCITTGTTSQTIEPHFIIYNNSGASVLLEELTVRYYRTNDTGGDEGISIYWAQVGYSNIISAIYTDYIEIGFLSAAGSISSGGNSGQVHSSSHYSNWANYDQSNDYSFDPSKTGYVDHDKITIFRNGVLVWGTEPDGSSVDTSTPNPTAVPTSAPTGEPADAPTDPPIGGIGRILYQYWTGLGDTRDVSDLTSSSNYPNSPSGSGYLTSFEAPEDWEDYYGSRIIGYLHPSVSGTYYFWIASDDSSELWLSTTSSASNKVKIAYLNGYCNPGVYDEDASQASSGISLNAGSIYYIEAIHKEGHGGDNLDVAWQPPGGSREVIPGNYLSPYDPGDNPTSAPTNATTDVPTQNPTPAPTGDGFSIPGLIVAEDYNDGGEGVGYHDTGGGPVLEACSEGGSNIAYIEAGEWLKYDVDVQAGYYYMEVRVATAQTGGSYHVEFNDVDVTGNQKVPITGGWQIYESMNIGPIELSGGAKTMKFCMDGGPFNLIRMSFTATSESPTPSPSPTPAPTPSPVPPPVSALHVEGKWIKDSSSNNITLHGVATGDLDAIYKGDRSHMIETTIFDIINYADERLGNVDVIRLDIHPEVNDETGNHGWLHYDPDWYFENIIDPAVGHVISKGMYAIIDWHYVGANYTESNVVANTKAFWLGSGSWAGIASKYANNPNVLFELFNEPGGGSWSSWQTTAQGWINGIRAKGANNIIIVGGPSWSQIMPGNSSELLSGANIVYACHIYPAHSGGGIPDWIGYVSTVAPVMMTEWGYENNGDANVTNGTATSYGYKFKEYINAKPNVGWIAWCFDYCYRSVMCDMNWKLLGNGDSTTETRYHGGNSDTYDNYMGYFTKDWLAECKN